MVLLLLLLLLLLLVVVVVVVVELGDEGKVAVFVDVVAGGQSAASISRVRSLRAKAGSAGNKAFPADPAFAPMAANTGDAPCYCSGHCCCWLRWWWSIGRRGRSPSSSTLPREASLQVASPAFAAFARRLDPQETQSFRGSGIRRDDSENGRRPVVLKRCCCCWW